MKVQTRMGRGRRIWVCPVCGWRATISTRNHFQTGQPLTNDQQVASLAVDAEKHFRAFHLSAFSHPRRSAPAATRGETEQEPR